MPLVELLAPPMGQLAEDPGRAHGLSNLLVGYNVNGALEVHSRLRNVLVLLGIAQPLRQIPPSVFLFASIERSLLQGRQWLLRRRG